MSEDVAKIRADILDMAKRCVCQDRNTTYGEPEQNFAVIARFWNIYLDACGYLKSYGAVDAADVAALMVLFKIARALSCPSKLDSSVDMCGYAAIYGELAGTVKDGNG